MEADTQGGLDPEAMGVFKYTEPEERYLRKSGELRLSRFVTEYGVSEFERQFRKRKSDSGHR